MHTDLSSRPTPKKPVLPFAVMVLSITGFVAANWLRRAGPDTFDHQAILFIHQIASPTLDGVMRLITWLGDPRALTLGAAGAAFAAFRASDRAGGIAAILTGMFVVVLNVGLKWWFARHRPELIVTHPPGVSAAFPSGHTIGATSIWGTVAMLAVRAKLVNRWLAFLLAATVAFIVGISRIYLGAHWPSDVLAGWSLGCALLSGGALGLWIGDRTRREPGEGGTSL